MHRFGQRRARTHRIRDRLICPRRTWPSAGRTSLSGQAHPCASTTDSAAAGDGGADSTVIPVPLFREAIPIKHGLAPRAQTTLGPIEPVLPLFLDREIEVSAVEPAADQAAHSVLQVCYPAEPPGPEIDIRKPTHGARPVHVDPQYVEATLAAC